MNFAVESHTADTGIRNIWEKYNQQKRVFDTRYLTRKDGYCSYITNTTTPFYTVLVMYMYYGDIYSHIGTDTVIYPFRVELMVPRVHGRKF